VIRIILILTFSFAFTFVNASEIIVSDLDNELDITPYCEEFVDASNELNITEVLDKKWTEIDGTLDYGSVKNVHWIRFKIKNTNDYKIEKELFIPYHHIHKIDLYVFEGDSMHFRQRKGTMRVNDDLVFNTGHNFKINLDPNSAYTVYIKFNHLYRPLRATSFLMSSQRLLDIQLINYRVLWFWRGAFLFAIIISIIIFFFVGLRIFLYYFVLNIGIAIFMASQLGDIFIFFNSGPTDISTVLDFAGATIVSAFFPLFLNTLVKIKQRNEIAWKWMFGFIYLMVVVFILNLFPGIRTSIIQYYSHIYMMFVAAMVFILQLVFLFKSILLKDKNALVLFIIYCFYVSTVFLNVILPNMGLLHGTPFVYNSLLAISMFEIFTFLILMGREALQVYKERAKLIKKEEKHQHEMMLSIIKAQEEERDRVGRTLHDSIGGSLAIIKQNLRAEDKKIQRTLTKTIDVVRTLSHGLVSPMVKQEDFQDELKELCYMFNSSRMKMHCYFHNWPELESLDWTTHFYRITQELIQNAIKHSKANNVYFQFIGDESVATLIYEDDGVGFNYDENSRGLGLRNIRNRLEIMNGTLDVD